MINVKISRRKESEIKCHFRSPKNLPRSRNVTPRGGRSADFSNYFFGKIHRLQRGKTVRCKTLVRLLCSRRFFLGTPGTFSERDDVRGVRGHEGNRDGDREEVYLFHSLSPLVFRTKK